MYHVGWSTWKSTNICSELLDAEMWYSSVHDLSQNYSTTDMDRYCHPLSGSSVAQISLESLECIYTYSVANICNIQNIVDNVIKLYIYGYIYILYMEIYHMIYLNSHGLCSPQTIPSLGFLKKNTRAAEGNRFLGRRLPWCPCGSGLGRLAPTGIGVFRVLGKWFCNLPSVNLVDPYASIHLSSN